LNLFPWRKKPDFFTQVEKDAIVEAIRAAEQRTSGEVRIFIESRCKFMDPIDRARELFAQLEMAKTSERNGTLVYVAVKDRQAAVYGDEGIHQKVGQTYWEDEVNKMLVFFKDAHLGDGICQVVNDIGEVLHRHFPYASETDKNELPDDIVFGR